MPVTINESQRHLFILPELHKAVCQLSLIVGVG